MGCLNANGNFNHWFGNIHLSGPCNRACYFCIGQHMMSLDSLNNLDKFPLNGFDDFIEQCQVHGIREINLTGSNTDPLLYRHIPKLRKALDSHINGLKFGIRTNGANVIRYPEIWALFDKASISIPSFDPEIYFQMMGRGTVPDIEKIIALDPAKPIKVNVVLGPVNSKHDHLCETLDRLNGFGIKKVNLREPYGQPNIGDPLFDLMLPTAYRFGMPVYQYRDIEVMYWDVHFVEVESVNLYANGRVSVLYPITAGHDPVTGMVRGQEFFDQHGRILDQWTSFAGDT